ncbi:AAA family ATPase [Vibrio cholerae]|uniref:AAA family ATPase n=1 Tax=Vibrio cholerae TaxID=666 RepID=UPI0018F0D375|nr:AAA family ATPase [Vibrio cholerae]MBJ6886015.1 ATP-binding protein [Vibrio cholerae]
MSNFKVSIKNLKNIKNFSLEIPVKQGLHVIAGSNGIGKSTIMGLLAEPFRPSVLWTIFSHSNVDSSVEYSYEGKTDLWTRKQNKWHLEGKKSKSIRIDGFIEGSVIHGTRFTDSNVLELSEKVGEEHLVDADEFINDNFNYVLHGKKFYPTIKKIKNKKLASELGFDSVPYFMDYADRRLSQFWLSSGENLLLSLLHFLNNKIFQQKRKGSKYISLILIDEVELALHPVAISRLVTLLDKLSHEFNLSVYFSSHSTELLRSIKPNNIYYLQSLPNKDIEVINPCYPAYATRFLYNQDGYDILILPEDELAKFVIDKIITSQRLYEGKLIHILPCGDWRNTVRLHKEILESNLTSHSTKVISVLDGDVTESFEVEKSKEPALKRLNVTFLPIPSLEKYLHEHLIDNVDPVFFRELNDRFYRKTSLDQVISEYQESGIERKGKKLWQKMVSSIGDEGISEKEFLREICNSIYSRLNVEALTKRIRTLF